MAEQLDIIGHIDRACPGIGAKGGPSLGELALAVAVHGGIATCLGMPTFGLAMIIANLAFVSDSTWRRWMKIGD